VILVLCACGEVARYHVYRAGHPTIAACVACADAMPFYASIKRFGPKPGPKRRADLLVESDERESA
jgi:hypothetical protein